MKKLILLLVLAAMSVTLVAQKPNVKRGLINFDASAVGTVQQKQLNLALAWGVILGVTNRKGVGSAALYTFGEQQKVHSYDAKMKYSSWAAGYYQDLGKNAVFSLGVLAGTTTTKANYTVNGIKYKDKYTYPILYTTLNWHTKGNGLDIGALVGVGYVQSRDYYSEPSNFPLTLGFTLGWDL